MKGALEPNVQLNGVGSSTFVSVGAANLRRPFLEILDDQLLAEPLLELHAERTEPARLNRLYETDQLCSPGSPGSPGRVGVEMRTASWTAAGIAVSPSNGWFQNRETAIDSS